MKTIPQLYAFFGTISLLILFTSCQSEPDFSPTSTNPTIRFSKKLQVIIQDQDGDRTLNGHLTGTFDTITETVIAFTFSPNILKGLKLVQRDLNKLLPSVTSTQPKSENPFKKECRKNCHKKFTDANGKKIKGRGGCKWACYFLEEVFRIAFHSRIIGNIL